MLRSLTKASAFVALGAQAAGCSLLIDWARYTADAQDSAAAGGAGSGDAATDLGAAGTDSAEVSPDTAALPDSAQTEAATNPPETGADVGSDSPVAPPACNSMTCMGCCSAMGGCHGGLSADSCGVGGQTCQDCQSTGLACAAGACAVGSHDAGKPVCTLTTCSSNLCIPVWQSKCCKSDGTCGCEVLYPPGPCL